MSETPEKKKKARLRYDNVFKTAWTDEFHFIKHSWKGNKFAFCESAGLIFQSITILRPSEKKSIFSWFYHTIFKVLTTQILYPKCNRMHHFASFWKNSFFHGFIILYLKFWLHRFYIHNAADGTILHPERNIFWRGKPSPLPLLVSRGFQRRRFFRNQPIRNKNSVAAMFVNGSGQNEQSL